MNPEDIREKPLLRSRSFVRGTDKPNDFNVGVAKFCIRIDEMVVCPGDCDSCPLICQKNPPVMYTCCCRCDWVAYGRLDVVHIAERVHRKAHEDQIRHRAYELYQLRGSGHGHGVEDWLRAEEEIRRKQTRIVATRLSSG